MAKGPSALLFNLKNDTCMKEYLGELEVCEKSVEITTKIVMKKC